MPQEKRWNLQSVAMACLRKVKDTRNIPFFLWVTPFKWGLLSLEAQRLASALAIFDVHDAEDRWEVLAGALKRGGKNGRSKWNLLWHLTSGTQFKFPTFELAHYVLYLAYCL